LKHKKIVSAAIALPKKAVASTTMDKFLYQDETWAKFSTLKVAMYLRHIHVAIK
jgi:hypothetical protein